MEQSDIEKIILNIKCGDDIYDHICKIKSQKRIYK